MPKPQLPYGSIPLHRGQSPPPTCPRCMDSKKWPEARKKNNPFVPPKWEAAPEATRLRYEAQGIRILAQCGGCMNYLVEVEEVEER